MFLSWFYINKCNTLMESLGHGICVFNVKVLPEGKYQLVALCTNRINNAIFTSGECGNIEDCIKQILNKLENAASTAGIDFTPLSRF